MVIKSENITNKQELHYFMRNSHKLSTLSELKKILKDRQIDLLFIDGDHSYEGVKKDFKTYAPLVKKTGLSHFMILFSYPLINFGMK